MNSFNTKPADPAQRTTDLDEVLAHYAELEAAGESVDLEAFIALHPEVEPGLREFFDGKQLLDKFVHRPGATNPAQLTAMHAGSQLGRFELRYEHARGGLGRVWKAHDPVLRREIALKEIREDQAQHPAARHRFLREAQVTGQLEHPNIVPVYELGSDDHDGRLFYAMRFIQGDTLHEVIEQHHRRHGRSAPQATRRLLNKFVSVCEAMAYAHTRGIVHRDLKPQNIAIGEFGEVVVMDWGLAKVGEKTDDTARTVGISTEASGEKTMGYMGTPAYMAPEQAAGKGAEMTGRTDVYGLGAILFEILTGAAPHRGPTTDAILQSILDRDTPLARERLATVPKVLELICAKAMAKSPDDRYTDALQLGRDIQHWLDDEPVSVCRETWTRQVARWQRRNRATVAIALMCALLLGTWAGWLTVEQRRQRSKNLLAWTNELHESLDQARFHITYDGDVEAGLDICANALGLRIGLPKLKETAERTADPDRASAEKVLEYLSELSLLRARGEAALAPKPSGRDALAPAVEDALAFAKQCERGAWAVHGFETFLRERGFRADSDDVEPRTENDVQITTALDHFLAGELYRTTRQLDEAIEWYDKTLKLAPNHFWAHMLIATCHFEQGRSLQAVESYKHAARLSDSAWVYMARSLALADLGRWDEAMRDLDYAEQLSPGFYGVLNNRGVVLLTRATEEDDATTPKRIQWLDEAAGLFQSAYAKNKDFGNAHNNRGRALHEKMRLLQQLGDVDAAEQAMHEAISMFHTAITTSPERVKPLINHARLEAERGDLEEAMRLLDEAEGLSRRDRRIALERARVHATRAAKVVETWSGGSLVRETHFQRALEEFAMVEAEGPEQTDRLTLDTWYFRAELRAEFLRHAVRQADQTAVDELLPSLLSDLDALVDLGSRGLPATALSRVFRLRADVRSIEQDARAALADYSRSLEVNSDQPSLRVRRGFLLSTAHQAALADYNQALQAGDALPNDLRAEAYNGRAYVLALAGDDANAVADAEQAVALAPDRWDVLFNAAVAYGIAREVAARERRDADLAARYVQRSIKLLESSREHTREDVSRWRSRVESERHFIPLLEIEDFRKSLE